jgi:hypothetical protein
MKRAMVEKVQVEVKILKGDKKLDWYYDLIGLPIKVILFQAKRHAVALSFLDHGMVCLIKDGDFVVIKGKDIRKPLALA